MANLTDGLGTQMQDDLLVLTGTTGNPFQGISFTGTTTFNNVGKNLGENRAFDAVILMKFNTTNGTTCITNLVLQDSDGSGTTTWSTMVGYLPTDPFFQIDFTGPLMPTTAPGAFQSNLPHKTFRTRTGRPLVRIHGDYAGSTHTYTFAILLNPIDSAISAG